MELIKDPLFFIMTWFDYKTCLLIDLEICLIHLFNFLDRAIHSKKNYLVFTDHFYISTNIFAKIKELIRNNLELWSFDWRLFSKFLCYSKKCSWNIFIIFYFLNWIYLFNFFFYWLHVIIKSINLHFYPCYLLKNFE